MISWVKTSPLHKLLQVNQQKFRLSVNQWKCLVVLHMTRCFKKIVPHQSQLNQWLLKDGALRPRLQIITWSHQALKKQKAQLELVNPSQSHQQRESRSPFTQKQSHLTLHQQLLRIRICPSNWLMNSKKTQPITTKSMCWRILHILLARSRNAKSSESFSPRISLGIPLLQLTITWE